MKNDLLFTLIVSFGLLLTSRETHAGDRDWATAGKILTGVIAADILVNHQPVWPQQRQQNSVSTFRIVKDPPPPPFYSPRQIEISDYELSPQPAVIPATPPAEIPPQPAAVPATPREEIPPQIATSGTAAAATEEPAVIHQLSPLKRIYQPRIQGHQAYVQERVSPNHPWVTVENYPSIW